MRGARRLQYVLGGCLWLLACSSLSSAGPTAPTAPPATAPVPAATPTAAPAAAAKSAPAPAGDQVFTLGGPAGIVAPLLGINMGPAPHGKGTGDLEALYKERGVTLIRTHDYKGAFDLTDEGYANTDAMLARIQKGGFQTYLRLGNSFGAGATQAGTAELTASMLAMLDHVQAASDPANRVKYVEIWNEPDNTEFWTQGQQAYIDLYIAVSRKIRAKHPTVKIGGPALTPAGVLTSRGRAFVEEFLSAVKRAGAPLDFLSWHLYSNHPEEFASAAQTYREASIKAGFGDLEQHITEWNTAFKAAGEHGDKKGKAGDGGGREGKAGGREGKAGGRGGGRGGLGEGDRDPAEQAARWAEKTDPQLRIGARASALTTASWIALQMGGVDQSLFYRGPDPAPYPSTFYGMFWNDGRPKPTGWAALLWKKMVDHPERLELSGSSMAPIWALAGRSHAGETALLLANESDHTASWGLACPANAVLPVQTESVRAPADAVLAGTQPDCSGVLEPYEVRLLTWKRSG